jgi:hypothetical protein
MYLSVCVRNYKQFQSGELYNTYSHEQKIFLRLRHHSVGAFNSVTFSEYQDHFIEINDDFCFSKPMIKTEKFGFLNLKRNFKVRYVEKIYRFETDLDTLCKLHVELLYDLKKIKFTAEDEEKINELLELLSYKSKYSSLEEMEVIIDQLKRCINGYLNATNK